MKEKNKYSIIYCFFFVHDCVKVALVESGKHFYYKGVNSSYIPKKEHHKDKSFVMSINTQTYLRKLRKYIRTVKSGSGEIFYPSSIVSFIVNQESQKERVTTKKLRYFERLMQYGMLTKMGWYAKSFELADEFRSLGVEKKVYVADAICVNLHSESKSIAIHDGMDDTSVIDFSRRPDIKSDLDNICFMNVNDAFIKLRRVKHGLDLDLNGFVQALKVFCSNKNIQISNSFFSNSLCDALKENN